MDGSSCPEGAIVLASFALATLAAVGCLLVAERRGSPTGRWIWKPLASTGFVATAVAAGASASIYGQSVLAALSFSWLGDVLLIPDDPRALRAGILSFLLGHVAFVVAFLARGVELTACVSACALVVPIGAAVLRWLWPRLAPQMTAAIVAYVGVISLMVVTATGTVVRSPDWRILAAALGFFASDLSVARDRFGARSFANRAWGLPLYYVAQLVFAVSAGS